MLGNEHRDPRRLPLTLFADSYLLVNDELIPTGELADVAATPFDFTKKKKIGKEMVTVGKKLNWDDNDLTDPNCPEADKYIKKTYRKGWVLDG